MTCPKSHSNLVVEPRQELPVLSVLCLVTQVCSTLCDPMDCSPPDSSVHGDFPCKDTRVGFHALLQEIFPTQGSNPGLLHCRWILYHLSHQGSTVLSTTLFFLIEVQLIYNVILTCVQHSDLSIYILFFKLFSLISSAQSCPTLCNPMNRSTPGLPVHHQLLEFTQTHVHRVSDAIQPSHPPSFPSPPAPNPSQHQGLFQ